ncbi:MAG: glyoxalase/bleomycin resistance/extradiol dioxygenase family protein [Calditrichaeota bacterium]|nr:MAG: glyoxalase/bleomycin resistance/extradiol dioxygenase family protein [Calditrichota bacterium]
MKLSHILESSLYVSDLERAEQFYRQVLGLSLYSRKEGRHVFFRLANGMLLLFRAEATEQPGGGVPAHGARGPGHLAFAVPQEALPAWKAHLQAQGVPIEAEVEWPGGGSSLYFRDPDGNSLELASPAIWRYQEAGFFHPPAKSSDG